jgi:transmembrane sensor
MKFLPKIVDSQFLIRVIRNEVGPEEREFFENWLEQSEENKEEFSNILLLWDKFQYSHLPQPPPQQEQWEKIESTISDADHSCPDSVALSFPDYKKPFSRQHTSYSRSSRSSLFSWMARIAAVIVLGFTLLYLNNSRETAEQQTTVDEVKSLMNIRYYTLSTGKGEKATLSLSDGSVIQMNAESRLIYPNYFGADSRELEFEGEGYFKISPDKSRPFRVKCNNTITEVTGTEFNIRSRDNHISVTVVEGSVKTFSSQSSEGVAVVKGEMVTLKSTGTFSRPVRVDTKHFLAWRENKISFSRTPLTQVAAELERCYSNIDIVVADSVKKKTITGMFDTNSLDEILSVFSLTLDIKVSKNGKYIYFE